jgi:hypothetical protein
MAHTSLGTKWVTAETIAAKISRNFKSLEFDIYDLVEWCAECEINIGDFYGFQRFNDVPIDVVNRKALLPCNIYRVLQVKSANCRDCPVYNYENNGSYLIFQQNSFTNAYTQNTSPPVDGTLKVLVDYIGIPIDPETGYPLIKEGHEEACYWYALTKLLFEDWLNGKIDNSRWEFINTMYGNYVQKAKSGFRHFTRDDMERLAMASMNIIPKLRFPKRFIK